MIMLERESFEKSFHRNIHNFRYNDMTRIIRVRVGEVWWGQYDNCTSNPLFYIGNCRRLKLTSCAGGTWDAATTFHFSSFTSSSSFPINHLLVHLLICILIHLPYCHHSGEQRALGMRHSLFTSVQQTIFCPKVWWVG